MLHRSVYQHTKVVGRLIPCYSKYGHGGNVPIARHFSLNSSQSKRVGVTLPQTLTGYLNNNNTEVPVGLWKWVGTKLGLKPDTPQKSSTLEDDDDANGEEGEFDINLGEEDTLHEVEAEIKKAALFSAVTDLHSTVKLNQRLPFDPPSKWRSDSFPADLNDFLSTFDTSYSKRRFLSAISAAELYAKRLPQYKNYALQCRAKALIGLANTTINTEPRSNSNEYTTICSLRREELIRTAAKDVETALDASASADTANQYFNLSTNVAFFDDYYSLVLAKEITDSLITKTSKEMKDTLMQLANLNAFFTARLTYTHAIQSHHRFRHAHMDYHVRNIFLGVIKLLTTSLRDYTCVPPKQSQEGELLGMLDFRSKLWEALDDKERAIADASLALDCASTHERLIRRANIYHKMKSYQLAIDDITKVVANSPFDFELSWLSTLYALNGQADKAIILWRYVLLNLPLISTSDGTMYSKIANFAIHSRLHNICLFASGEGIAIETVKPEPSHHLIMDLYCSRATAHYNLNEIKESLNDILSGLNWHQSAIRDGKETEVVKKAAAELHFLRGSIYIYQNKIKEAFKDYDEAVRLDPTMLQRVKEFQDNLTVTKNRVFIYINQYQIISFVLICAGLYVGFAVLR